MRFNRERVFTAEVCPTVCIADYIFILDAPQSQSTITGVLSGHRTEDLQPGLPQLGVCGSDHVLLSAEIVFTPTLT